MKCTSDAELIATIKRARSSASAVYLKCRARHAHSSRTEASDASEAFEASEAANARLREVERIISKLLESSLDSTSFAQSDASSY